MANEMQRLRVILKSSVSGATKTAICKVLALLQSSTLGKDSTGIHSERGLPGSDGGDASNRVFADANSSTSDAAGVKRSDLSSAFFARQ